MSARDNRRLLVFAIVAAVLFALAALWYQRVGDRGSPEERARQQAEQLREKVHDLTHGK